MPVPVERPSAKIAKLFPQADPGKAVAATAVAQAAQAVPLPAARPEIAPDRPARRYRHHRTYRHRR
jgi:membrane-bound lytic murein transglycosylase A